MKHSEHFNVNLDSIPLINLRSEFNKYYTLIRDNDFCAQFGNTIQPIKSPYIIWLAMPNDFLSLLIQRAISGIESYLRGAVYIEAGLLGKLNKESFEYINNPWEFKGRTITINYYHHLPSIIDESASLKNSTPTLWEMNEHFYKEIRNPIFHGHHLYNTKMEEFRKLYDHILDIYEWIDQWHSPENIISGGSSLSLRNSKKTPK